MKYLMIILVLLATDPLKVRRINSTKSEAKDAFQSGDYQTAVAKYNLLIDSLGVVEDELVLNRAHAYYLLKDTAHALSDYQSLLQSTKSEIVSRAGNQLGLMSNQKSKPEEALRYFKQALRADPTNDVARYNYEMLKKKLDKQKKEDEKNNKDKNDKRPEPSEFAKRLKAMADRLVAERRYGEAHALMADGLKQDETVAAYQEYIDRIKDVTEINQ